MGVRVVARVYRDGRTKPHLAEFKADIFDEDQLYTVADDIHDFISNTYYEHEDEEGDEDDSSSDESSLIPATE